MGSGVPLRVPVGTSPRHHFLQLVQDVPDHGGVGSLVDHDPGRGVGNIDDADPLLGPASMHGRLHAVRDVQGLGLGGRGNFEFASDHYGTTSLGRLLRPLIFASVVLASRATLKMEGPNSQRAGDDNPLV